MTGEDAYMIVKKPIEVAPTSVAKGDSQFRASAGRMVG